MMTSSIVKVSLRKLFRGDWHRNKDDTNGSHCAKGEPDGDEDAEWSDSEEDDFIDNEGKSYESNTKIDIAIRMMQ